MILPGFKKKLIDWRKLFNKALTKDELENLGLLTSVIDELWTAHVEQLRLERMRTDDELDYWGREKLFDTEAPRSSFASKDAILNAGIYDSNTVSATPYRRLKFVMDYWCALWFWPLDKLEELPDRTSWISEVTLILTGKLPGARVPQDELFESQSNFLADQRLDLALKLEELGALDWKQLRRIYPRIRIVETIAQQHRFHHWELEFADVFYPDPTSKKRGGIRHRSW